MCEVSASASRFAKPALRRLRAALASVVLFTATACDAQGAPAAAEAVPLPDIEIGAEYQPCEHCPTFVRVPDAPDSLRPIQYVGKYELTWNDYISSVDDGACTIPNPYRPPFYRARPDGISPNLEWFRIDWPITILGPREAVCYADWLSAKSGVVATLPTFDEWRWFATAGNVDWRFPWGNDPIEDAGALYGTDIELDDRLPWPNEAERHVVHRYMHAFKVGQFEPNPWGIHDLMGNARELTADIEQNPNVAEREGGSQRVVIAGTNHSDRAWSADGINAKHYALIWGDLYSARVAIRLVLLRQSNDE